METLNENHFLVIQQNLKAERQSISLVFYQIQHAIAWLRCKKTNEIVDDYRIDTFFVQLVQCQVLVKFTDNHVSQAPFVQVPFDLDSRSYVLCAWLTLEV